MSLLDALKVWPKCKLMSGRTPIHRLERVEKALNLTAVGIKLYVKRDDVMLLGGGGNKLRKLEYLLGDALSQRADTLIATGGRQSNFARLAAAAAARNGLSCELVLANMVEISDPDYVHGGNVLLDQIFGARIHELSSGDKVGGYVSRLVEDLARSGRSAYVATLGGSSPIGCLGYVECALEIEKQARELGTRFTSILVPNGSAGTHAGLLAGWCALGNRSDEIRSYSVLTDAKAACGSTLDKANATLEMLGYQPTLVPDDIHTTDSQLGAGYGLPTQSMVEAVHLMGTQEGLLLDPVYSGKAFAGILADLAEGKFNPGEEILFVMTGGSPGLFAYSHHLVAHH
ncbi:D-cysteine desulfhydrase family protein [Roseibium sp. M-1]